MLHGDGGEHERINDTNDDDNVDDKRPTTTRQPTTLELYSLVTDLRQAKI